MGDGRDEDRERWDEKYRTELHEAKVNANLVRFAHLLKRGRVLDLAGGLGQNGAWLASQSAEFRMIDADIAYEALLRAPHVVGRAVSDAGALPFAPHCFDTVLNIRFYDPRVSFWNLLTRGGTVFLETFSTADQKYRPDFNPAYLLNPNDLPIVFRGLDVLYDKETDDGKRVYVTVIARNG